LCSIFVCRLLNHMRRRGYRTCVPACDPATLDPHPLLDLTSGYVRRAAEFIPKQSSKRPWLIRQNYLFDMINMKLAGINDGVLRFAKGPATSPPNPLSAAGHQLAH
jgi:hypothetical protein